MGDGKNVTLDPVCGMRIDEAKCSLVSVYQGKEYRFCAPTCQKAFELAPEKYISTAGLNKVNEEAIKDLEEMYNIITTAVEIHGRERDFFLREASSSTRPIPKALFSELADDLNKDFVNLISRKEKIMSALEDLQRTQREGKTEVNIFYDPVCGMRVEKSNSQIVSAYNGREYHFCSEGCKKAFDMAPEKYVDKGDKK